MAEFGDLEKNAVRREGSTKELYFIGYKEYDSLNRIVYEATAINENNGIKERHYEYYKKTNWITKFSMSYKDDKYQKDGRTMLFTNEAKYFKDGSLKYLKLVGDSSKVDVTSKDWEIIKSWEIPIVSYEKKYDTKGRLVYYKDSTGYECEWTYDKHGGYVCNMIGIGRNGEKL